MKDILQDIVAHTHALGVITVLRVETDSKTTTIGTVTEDRSLILQAETHNRIGEFEGVFGMNYLDKLNLHLKNPEYQEDAKIEVVKKVKDGDEYPSHLHFENVIGDFQNDYKFVNSQIMDSLHKAAKFKGANWNVEFEPPVASITRMKLMSAAHSDSTVFVAKTEGKNLVFTFGESNDHEGQFVFKHNVGGTLSTPRAYPVNLMQSILSLSGESYISISDQGIMKISIDSGLAKYDYILPAQSK